MDTERVQERADGLAGSIEARPTGCVEKDDLLSVIVDGAGTVVYVSDGIERIIGHRAEDLRGRNVMTLLHPDMPLGVLGHVCAELDARSEAVAYLMLRTVDEEMCWALAEIFPRRPLFRGVGGYHAVMRAPHRRAVEGVRPIYAAMVRSEAEVEPPEDVALRLRDGSVTPEELPDATVEAGMAVLDERLRTWGQSYSEFVWSLVNATPVELELPVRRDRRGRPVRPIPLAPTPR